MKIYKKAQQIQATLEAQREALVSFADLGQMMADYVQEQQDKLDQIKQKVSKTASLFTQAGLDPTFVDQAMNVLESGVLSDIGSTADSIRGNAQMWTSKYQEGTRTY